MYVREAEDAAYGRDDASPEKKGERLQHVQTADASRHDVAVMLKLQPVRRNSALNE